MDMWEMMLDTMNIETNLDLIFVIDASSGMEPLVSLIKQFNWYEIINNKLNVNKRNVDKMRFKVIWYRDINSNSDAASWGESDFFVIPNEERAFKDYLGGIHIHGNLEQTSGLTALIRATKAEWNYSGDKQRHVIMLFSDKKVDLEENADRSNSIEEFESEWERDRTLRLVLVTPDVFPWTYIKENVYGVAGFVIEENQGGREFELDNIIDLMSLANYNYIISRNPE